MGEQDLPNPIVMDTNPSSPVMDSGWPGIGRVLAIENYLLVNNLYRNFEIWQFSRPGRSGREGEVERVGCYNDTAFPGEDDVHAAFLHSGGRLLLVINHYGRIQGFRLPLSPQGPGPESSFDLQFFGDTERIVLAKDCFIASSPRGHQTHDPPQPGIFISQPIGDLLALNRHPKIPHRLKYRQELAEWGMVTALAAAPHSGLLAVASGARVGLFALEYDAGGLRLVQCLWERTTPYYTQWIGFDPEQSRLLVAGYSPSPQNQDSYKWDECCGGGLVSFSLQGECLLESPLPEATAWGYGGVPVVLSRDGNILYGVDRVAGLHSLSTRTGAMAQIYRGPAKLDGVRTPSLGIGHCDILQNCLYAGFSRGDYRLFRYELS